MSAASPQPLASNQVAGTFPPARIAAVLGRAPYSIRRELEGLSPDGVQMNRGNAAAAYLVTSLPAPLQTALRAEAEKRGYASEEHLLKAPPARWEPALPLSQLDAAEIERAGRLQRALGPSLLRLQDPRNERAEVLRHGLADYAREFGATPSPRHFERLLKRTLDRDLGEENWSRLELFLADRLAARKPSAIATGGDERWAAMLREASHLATHGEIDAPAECLFWDAACACHREAVASGVPDRRARRELCRVIENKVPFIKSRGRALEAKVRRALAKWSVGGESASALSDGRKSNVGRPVSTQLPDEYRSKLLARSINSAGGLAQAWRESLIENWMPAAVASAYDVTARSKSYVPPRIRNDLGPEIDRLASLTIGPKQADLAGPYVERTYDKMPSGVEFQSDDCTLPVYFWIPDENGQPRLNEKGRPILTRGQFLP